MGISRATSDSMVHTIDANETGNDTPIKNNPSVIQQPLSPQLPLTPPAWLKRARIICALAYILFQTIYFIFLIICIALYPRCEKAPLTPQWMNSVFLRVSIRDMKFHELAEKIDQYKDRFDFQTLWISSILPLSKESNPMEWTGVDNSSGGEVGLIQLIEEVHKRNLTLIVDYPLNHVSIRSNYFTSNDDSYFVWNKQGNSSNWMTVDNSQRSTWVYNARKKSFYLRQFFHNDDSIDINYRNNRVFNDVINSLSYWTTKFNIDGFNLQGISYAYEDYEYKNNMLRNNNRTRHLDEDYLLLARIRSDLDENKTLLLDTVDSLETFDENLLARYYGDNYLGGVQLASLNNFTLVSESQTNITSLFEKYNRSLFFQRSQQLIWSSSSTNSRLNEIFFVTSLFQNVSIAINAEIQQNFSVPELGRLRNIIKLVRTLDVFRVGRIKQEILSKSNWLTIERARRGSKHYMIIANFGQSNETDQIYLTEGITDAVEIYQTNIEDLETIYKTNTMLELEKPIHLKSYEYIIIRWLPSIDSLTSILRV